jgi:DNA-binding GntR family transcriptional regulator
MAPRSPSLKVIRPTRMAASTSARASDDADAQTTTRRIVDAVSAAIVERRLMPGTKLAEQRIADIFKVSRTVVRQALNQLSRDRLIVLEPGRGAFVRQPSAEEARQVFEARALVEAGLVRQLCAQITDVQLARLRAHLADEAAAVARTDVPGRTRLLADFHVLLAQLLGNEVLAEVMGDLLSRSSLVSLMMQSAHSAEESHAEHVAIVDALGRRDARTAIKLMNGHLGSVERNLRLNPRSGDLAEVLQPDTPPNKRQRA